MIRSMTSFASAEREGPWGALSVELRSVNHRYLELAVRLPEDLRSLEPAIRERVGARIGRGKVDFGLRHRSGESAAELTLNEAAIARLAAAHRTLGEHFPGLRTEFAALLAWPGVLVEQRIDQDGLREAALAVVDAALEEFVAAREREGARLAVFLRERLDGIEALVAGVRAHLPEVRAALRARFDARIADLKQPLEPGRVEQEVVLSLQRIDVDEELDRLTAHIAEARRVLGLREAVGRRLDFLMQEFNREANTLGSKAADPRTTQAAVELKVLIEQMREQVQNLE
ncbi:MAG: YicC family protein [Rhodanobacter denitrificans]|uniref:YicC family protein n=1 Tax=Rhodanobacter denitrificans TaxID=666685 RepID=A0A2W5M834_9GAMM|nr:MAG: YicC family protein [Rhodanobacter denitrificans]